MRFWHWLERIRACFFGKTITGAAGVSMRIAIFGWGSLIWDPRELPREGVWQEGGPVLSVEFSRISSDGRLTLVIDAENGAPAPTRFVQSPRVDLDDAISDLKLREGTSTRHIGYLNLRHGKQACRIQEVAAAVRDWANANGFDAVVWTDLGPNYQEERGIPFSVEAAEAYLRGLPKTLANRARKYIQNAPAEVNTPLRQRLRESGWLEN